MAPRRGAAAAIRELPEALIGPDWRLRRRDGFKLTDARMQPREVLSEIHYCVLCHERDKDSCSKGLHDEGRHEVSRSTRSASSSTAVRSTRRSPRCTRCARPAMRSARWRSSSIDNPMCPGTGHRICNDCMKSCIYQKQEPVNIPQIETGVLTDVLEMPWGVEIYGLLTRWNPLNVRRPYALPYNGKNVLVVGLGPAGYTLAHYLVNEGFGVVGIDGLKIEPLPEELAGTDDARAAADSRLERDLPAARRARARRVRRRVRVRHHRALGQELPDAAAPDAGAAPRRCGCTAASASAARMPIEDAWALRVRSRGDRGRRRPADDHRHEEQPDSRDPEGQRLPDGAAADRRVQARALPNLQARLPAVVIGGGLTAIDTATELMAYYPLQVEKTLRAATRRWSAELGEARVRALYDAEELELLDEYLRARPRGPRRARPRGQRAGEAPDFMPLVRGWGGVTHRLPQAHGRFAGLPAEPRRGDQGARRRHRVRREPEPDRGGRRRARRACRR